MTLHRGHGYTRDMRNGWVWAVGVLLGAMAGCSASPSGGVCCPTEIRAGYCGCYYVGGFATSMETCPRECDGADYVPATDEHGCTVYRSHGSCLEHFDAGLDGSASASARDAR